MSSIFVNNKETNFAKKKFEDIYGKGSLNFLEEILDDELYFNQVCDDVALAVVKDNKLNKLRLFFKEDGDFSFEENKNQEFIGYLDFIQYVKFIKEKTSEKKEKVKTEIWHVVKEFQTLESIADIYGVSVEDIKKNNKFKYPNLYIGQCLRIIK